MKNKVIIYFYYALLLLLLASRQSATAEPPFLLRILFLGLVVFPTVYIKHLSFPAIITMFYTISLDGFAYSYMPYTLWIYVVLTILITFTKTCNTHQRVVPYIWVIFTVYISVIDFILGTVSLGAPLFQNIFFCLILICCFLRLSINQKETISQLFISFATITIVLSLAFLTHREQFIINTIDGMDRAGWTDPNYFGMAIGMGSICSLIKIFDSGWKQINIIEKLLFLSAIFLSLPTLALNASRGAALSVVLCFIVLLLCSKVRLKFKLITFILTLFSVIYLYYNQYFALMEYRILNDDGTGSERTLIWASKLIEFSRGNLLQMIFGYSHYGGLNITGSSVGFHNDYIGFLVDYGVIGIVLLVSVMLYPIIITPKSSPHRLYVFVIILYLLVCFLTLEPFLTGILSYFVFYMLALLIATSEKNTHMSIEY